MEQFRERQGASGNGLLEVNPGGAPCNVLAMLRKLDKRCAFIGKVGRDAFGSLSLTHPAWRETTQAAVARARKAGALISFDPNLREPLWANLEDAREQSAWGLVQWDTLKISDNELEFMTGTKDFGEGVAILWKKHSQIRLLNVTAGDDGSICYYGSMRHHVKKMNDVHVLEKTGAGDTFCACILNYVLEHGVDGLTEDQLHEMLLFANAAAACVIERKGALKVMPNRDEIARMLAQAEAWARTGYFFLYNWVRRGEQLRHTYFDRSSSEWDKSKRQPSLRIARSQKSCKNTPKP